MDKTTTAQNEQSGSIEAEYDDVLRTLAEHGFDAGIADTGGGCESIEIPLDDGGRLLVNDKDDLLAWERANHSGWSVSRFDEDGEMVQFESTKVGSVGGLLVLIAQLVDRQISIGSDLHNNGNLSK
ncbi:hypothetical protein [Nocardia aurantia]|uniref:Uncharacterized protein n=1 Tax=Nocardia aurantia TaxID=2585199 RepID=A0A7K0DKA3_9NOCA|nr:hypothetical protein [Nocardia aurantia]MQY26097.1 hypothetical protein [Nocardia aurantia]